MEQNPCMPLYVTFYEAGPDALELLPVHFPAHQARIDEFHSRGDLLMVGTFADPIEEGSMAVFRTREAAEAFVAGDPFVTSGAVGNWYLREWNEVLSDL
jgi:uncharacterized protein YciI